MKRLLPYFLTVCLAISLLTGCSTLKTPNQKYSVKAIKVQEAPKISAIRLEALKQTARSTAAQGALAWRSEQLNAMLTTQKRNLDHIFNFNYLILNKNVMPPILVEANNTLNLADDFTIRVSDKEYQIIQPPRFITTPPNWRNYIWMAYKKPEDPNYTLLPQNPVERKIWDDSVKTGWREGIEQADQIFTANLARLRRDYNGMVLYRKLLAQNMVSPPYVSQADLGITGDANKININDRILRITAIPQFKTETKNWRPALPIKKQKKCSATIKISNKKGKI